MKERLLRVAKWAMYPAFYVACLALFGYLTFPFGLLKDRVIAEFARKGKPGQRLEIEKLSSYWFSGVEVTNVKLILPPDEPAPGGFGYPAAGGDFGGATPAAAPPKETVIVVDEGHVRVRIFPLLIGRVRVDFWASTMGGEIRGVVPVGGSGGDVELELTKVELGKIEPLTQALGLPLKGTATGKLALSSVDGKFSKADGSLNLTIEDILVGDGKTKIQGIIELPAARVGTLTLTAEAKEGVLKVTKLAAQGADVELIGDGRITTKEPWNESQADLYLRFKFTDAYRMKSDTTKTLLGDPTSPLPGLIEMQVPKMKKAKRADGFFGWHMHGALKNPKFDPSTVDVAPPAAAAASSPPKGGKFKKSTGITLPFGASTANDPPPSPPSPPPMSPPPQRAPEEPIRIAPPEQVAPPPVVIEQPPPPPPAPEVQQVQPQAIPEGIQPAPEQPAEVPR
ncbi:MAG: type II secretion system protein GspN [Byssovorax sp.]